MHSAPRKAVCADFAPPWTGRDGSFPYRDQRQRPARRGRYPAAHGERPYSAYAGRRRAREAAGHHRLPQLASGVASIGPAIDVRRSAWRLGRGRPERLSRRRDLCRRTQRHHPVGMPVATHPRLLPCHILISLPSARLDDGRANSKFGSSSKDAVVTKISCWGHGAVRPEGPSVVLRRPKWLLRNSSQEE